MADRVLCVCQRETENVEDLVLSHEDNPKTHRLNREILCETGIHWLTVQKIIIVISSSTVSNDVVHSSCLKPIALPVWLAASSCCKRYSLTSYSLGMKSVYRRTTIQLTERSGLCTSRYQEATHRSQLLRTRLTFSRSVMVSVVVSTMGVTELIFFELTLGWRWTASITAMYCCLSRCFQQSRVS